MSSILQFLRNINTTIDKAQESADKAQESADKAQESADKLSFDYTQFTESKPLYSQEVYTGLPVMWIDGDLTGISKENKVTVEYAYSLTSRDKAISSGTCTLKWQGATSSKYPKKNYSMAKMSTPLDVGWGAQKKYCLKANYTDAAHVRNIASARLWGQIVATHTDSPLNGKPNNGAMDGHPIMLVLNGEFHGLYTLNIPKDQWAFDMDESLTEWLVTAEANYPATNFKDVCKRDETDFAVEYAADDVENDTVFNSLDTMLTSVVNATGDNWQNTCNDYFDISTMIDYFIFSILLLNDDGFHHNYILSTYDGVKWYINAYDLDTTFGCVFVGSEYYKANFKDVAYISTQNRVFSLIYKYSKDEFVKRYWELRQDIMSEDNVSWVMNHVIDHVPEPVFRAEQAKWTHLPGTATSNISKYLNWYRLRCIEIDQEIESL